MKLFVFIFIVSGVCGCSSTLKQGTSPTPVREVDTVLAFPLKIRRPPGEVVDPQAGPGGPDYSDKKSTDPTLGCRDPESLFQKWQLGDILSCFESIEKEGHDLRVTYVLARRAEPELRLHPDHFEDQGFPDCIRKLIPQIPVPRELLFFEQRRCLVSRIPIEADEILGIKLPIKEMEMIIDFPLASFPEHERALVRQLIAWSLTPFFGLDAGHRVIPAKRVSDQMCKACMGEDVFEKVDPEKPEQPTWP